MGSTTNVMAQTPDSVKYYDSKFDFSFEYPADWSLTPRKNDESYGVLSITGPMDEHAFDPQIFIGHYLFDISPSETLKEWVAAYPDELGEQTTIHQQYPLELAGKQAWFVSGHSPITEFQFVAIRNGEMVWFVWANFNENKSEALVETFNNIADSLDFGPDFPSNLQDIYGEEFVPLAAAPLTDEQYSASDYNDQWHVPVYGNWQVACGSPYHTAGASYAADIGANQYVHVVASRGGTVLLAGWDNTGYGNVVKVDTNGYYHLYGHLNSIYTWNFVNGWYVSKDTEIGEVGNTGGTSTGVHLHFHIHTGSQYTSAGTGVNLSGLLIGFTANSNYPSVSATCGYTSR